MKNKKIIIAIVSAIVLLMLIGIPIALKPSNKVSFQSKEEMTEVINGTWRTGDTEFDFVLTIGGGIVNFSMDGKDDEEPDNFICVPDKGYFYFESDGDNKDDRYYVVKDNGEYLIHHGNWMFYKAE